MGKCLVTDFDGTITRRDFFELVRERWPVRSEDDPWERYVRGEITHFAALAEIFGAIRASESEVAGLVEAMQVDPALGASVRELQAAGWEVVVASAGCDWYIGRLLREAEVSVRIHANPGEFTPDEGLVMRWPEGAPFVNRETGVDKLAVVRDALARCDTVAFAGDGRPDLEPSLLVPPKFRFARGWLAGALEEKGEAYCGFESWSQIAAELLRC